MILYFSGRWITHERDMRICSLKIRTLLTWHDKLFRFWSFWMFSPQVLEALSSLFLTTLVDGFSKLWLQGKGNLGEETLSPAGCMCGRLCSARVPGPVLGRVRKPYQHQHLQYTKGE